MLELASKIDLKSSSSRKKEFAQLILLSIILLLFYEIYPLINKLVPKGIFVKLMVLVIGAIIICGIAYWRMKTTHIFSQKISFSNHKFSTIIFTAILVLEILLATSTKFALFKANIDKAVEIVVAAIVIGFIEEFLFRGVLFNAFIALFAKNYYVIFWTSIFTSIIFGCAHALNLFHQDFSITLIQIMMAACLGMLFAYIHVITNELRWCIALHAWHDMSLQLVKPSAPNNIWLFVIVYLVIFLIMCWAMFSYNKKLNIYLKNGDKSLI